LIAEEVSKIYPELVVYGNGGQIESVQYHQLPAMLLNEVQKQHRTIKLQQTRIDEQTEIIKAMEVRIYNLGRTTQIRLPASHEWCIRRGINAAAFERRTATRKGEDQGDALIHNPGHGYNKNNRLQVLPPGRPEASRQCRSSRTWEAVREQCLPRSKLIIERVRSAAKHGFSASQRRIVLAP
jgi:hypothetical protein